MIHYKQLDNETDLQYFEKRYYDPRIGRFTTEDPVFWEVGFTERPNQYFIDPQQWNSYSYVRNNPVNLVDPTGELVLVIAMAPEAIVATAAIVGWTITQGDKIGNFLQASYNAITSSTSTSTNSSQAQSASSSVVSNQSKEGQTATGQGQTISQSSAGSPSPSGGGGKKDDKNGESKSSGKQRFENDNGTILKNSDRYEKIKGRQTQGAQWYKEKSTGNIVYRDNFHKNELEVFSKNKVHLGTADPITGRLTPGTAIKGRTIK